MSRRDLCRLAGTLLLCAWSSTLVAVAEASAQTGSVAGTIGFASGEVGFVSGGIPPANVYVNVHRVDTGALAGLAYTDASLDWEYVVRDLPPGSYRIRYLPDGGTYGEQWWNDVDDQGAATVVVVAAGGAGEASPTLGLRRAALYWKHRADGALAVWTMAGVNRAGVESVVPDSAPAGWDLAGTGDFDGDGNTDILWRRNRGGGLRIWLMDGATRIGARDLTPNRVGSRWKLSDVRDFNRDGKADILWHDRASGELKVWFMSGVERVSSVPTSPAKRSPAWGVAGTGDFNGDGNTDVLWRERGGEALSVWFMNGATRIGATAPTPATAPASWSVAAVGDFTGDDKPDILWRRVGGDLFVWQMDGLVRRAGSYLAPRRKPGEWRVAGYNAHPRRQLQTFDDCERCHDGSVAQAPNVMRFWYGSRKGQDGGHGDPDGRGRAVPCTACHDINLPAEPLSARHATGTYNSVYGSGETASGNTAHLRAEFFDTTRASPPTAVADGDWKWQTAFDNYCAYSCHVAVGTAVTSSVPDMRHERDTDGSSANHWSVEMGTHLTVPDGDALYLGANYPMIRDLTTDAAGGADYAPCVACHDPHGTGIVGKNPAANRMVREDFYSAQVLCFGCHQ